MTLPKSSLSQASEWTHTSSKDVFIAIAPEWRWQVCGIYQVFLSAGLQGNTLNVTCRPSTQQQTTTLIPTPILVRSCPQLCVPFCQSLPSDLLKWKGTITFVCLQLLALVHRYSWI